MGRIFSSLFVIVGVIHLVPLIGIIGVSQLESLYGVTIVDTNLEVLMRHRAGLLGGIGIFLIYSGLMRVYEKLGLIISYYSILTFLIIYFLNSSVNQDITKVAVVDVFAIVLTIMANVMYVLRPKDG